MVTTPPPPGRKSIMKVVGEPVKEPEFFTQ
jgi:hypothetical protein